MLPLTPWEFGLPPSWLERLLQWPQFLSLTRPGLSLLSICPSSVLRKESNGLWRGPRGGQVDRGAESGLESSDVCNSGTLDSPHWDPRVLTCIFSSRSLGRWSEMHLGAGGQVPGANVAEDRSLCLLAMNYFFFLYSRILKLYYWVLTVRKVYSYREEEL
jgi:hypothetical protein